MTKPSTVIFPALLAAICFIVAEMVGPREGRQSVWFFVGWLFIIVAAVFATVILVEHRVIEKTFSSMAMLFSRMLYREVAMAYAIAEMDSEARAMVTSGYIMEAKKAIIRFNGVELDPDWVINFLLKAQAYFPEYPSYRNHREDERENRDNVIEAVQQKALRGYLRAKGRLQPRDNQTDLWINGWTPINTLIELGYVED